MYNSISRLLTRFLAAAEGARRFHGEALGKDVDPHHCLADYLVQMAGVARGLRESHVRLEKVYHAERVKTAMAVTPGGSVGGYLVPPDLRDDLMQDVSATSLFRSRALVVPMTENTVTLPLPDATTAQATGVPTFFGGMQFQWATEASTRTESEPAFRSVELNAWELTSYLRGSRPLLDDAGKPLEMFLRQLIGRAIAWFEDYAFLRGSGVGQPLGFLNSPSNIPVTRFGIGKVQAVDVGKMMGSLLPVSWESAIWLCDPSLWPQFMAMAGWQPNQPVPESAAAGPPPHAVLNGLGLYVIDKLTVLGNIGDLILIDPARYVIGDRQGLQIDVSFDEPNTFLANQAVWRVVQRVGGTPWLNASIKLASGTQASTAVILN